MHQLQKYFVKLEECFRDFVYFYTDTILFRITRFLKNYTYYV